MSAHKKILRVIWWNCGLSGLKHRRARLTINQKSRELEKVNQKIASAKDIILMLIPQTDILVLGEYACFGVRDLVNEYNCIHAKNGANYGVIDLCESICGTRQTFDNLVIYNKKVVTAGAVSRCVNAGTLRRIQRYKVYQIIPFSHLNESDFRFELAVVHWRMRDGYGGDAQRLCKCKAAEKLLRRMSTKSAYPYKIIVGDFNNEPYEDPFQWMVSTRSSEYAETYNGLYNPFWRYMDGEHYTIYSPANHDFHDNGAVFDNILVNSKFLGLGSRWHLEPDIMDAKTFGYSMEQHDHQPISMDFSRM